MGISFCMKFVVLIFVKNEGMIVIFEMRSQNKGRSMQVALQYENWYQQIWYGVRSPMVHNVNVCCYSFSHHKIDAHCNH
jgi:hypothetical protein